MQDDDDELARAIALSLQESKKEVIVLDSDSEGDDDEKQFEQELRMALAASKADSLAVSTPSSSRGSHVESSQTSSARQSPPPANATQLIPGSTFISERAQLERERLARQKRLRKEPSPKRDISSDESDPDDIPDPIAKRQRLFSSLASRPNAQSRSFASSASSAPSTSAQSLDSENEMFWNGELRQVANRHADASDKRPKFRLTQVLGPKTELAFAIISSYVASVSWIYEFFDPSVPVIIVGQPDQSGNADIKNILPNWVRTTAFLRNGFGCMHMKFMLLFYKTGRLRVVISTANLIDYDYRDIENSLWLQDIPRLTSPRPRNPKISDDFPTLFEHVLQAVNVQPALKSMLKSDHPNLPLQAIDHLSTHWDWSKVTVHLVASIAGKHEGWPKVILTGHPRLMKAIRNMGLRTGKTQVDKHLGLECQGSSIGTYTTQWMNEFYWSARGESAENWLDVAKKRRETAPYPPIKVIFPSLQTVRDSVLGERGGGTMFCARRTWSAAKFPRDLFYDSNSKAGRVLMHSKMILGLLNSKASKRQAVAESGSETEDSDDDVQVVEPAIGWAYVGSHNFTPSAWGTMSGSSFNPVLNIRNYELGIVFPIKDEAHLEKVACWRRPARKYGEKDLPWMQEESAILQQAT